MGNFFWLALFFAMVIVRLRAEEGGAAVGVSSPKSSGLPQTNDVKNEGKNNKTYNEVVVNNKRKNNGGGSGGGGGGGVGWGWGGGGGGGNRGGGWGWGSGGGGGVFWRWGCNGRHRGSVKKRVFPKGDYAMGEFAQCMVRGRCKGMRLDCPLHCGGPCVYDCRNVCKAHCKR